MSRPGPRRESGSNSGSNNTISPSSTSPGSRLTVGAPGTLRSSASSIYSLSPTSRRHLTPLTNPAPSISTTSLSPSHARSTQNGPSTAASTLRRVASNASIRLKRSHKVAAATSSSSRTETEAQSSSAAQGTTDPGGSQISASSKGTDTTIQPPPDKTAAGTSGSAEPDSDHPASTMKRKTPPPSPGVTRQNANARRRTWWGFGGANPGDDGIRKPDGDSNLAGAGDVPPPMDADEAAFRLALGSGAGPGARAVLDPPPVTAAADAEALSAGAGDATLTPERVRAMAAQTSDQGSEQGETSQQARPRPNQARTTNSRGWFTWRAQAQTPAPNSREGALKEEDSKDAASAAKSESSSAPAPSVALQIKPSQPAYSSPLRRMWAGTEGASDSSAGPSHPTSAQEPTRAPPPAEPSAPNGPSSNPALSQPSSPALDASNSSTWRFSLWGGRAPPPTSQDPSAQEQKPAMPTSAGDSDIPSIVLNKEAQVPTEVDSRASTGDPSSTSQAGYASYIASWIPGWSTAQGQGPSSSAGLEGEAAQTSSATEQTFQPRTPAEQVKADALSRPERTPAVINTVSAGIQKLVDPSEAILNTATRKSWVSFFSSRNAQPPRRIQDAAAANVEDGPEVMDLDEDGPSSLRAPTPAQRSTTASIAESAPAALQGSSQQQVGKGNLAATAAKNSAHKAVAGAKQASAVASSASSVISKIAGRNGGSSPTGSAPTSPVVGPLTKTGSLGDKDKTAAEVKGKTSIPATIKQKLSNATLALKASQDASGSSDQASAPNSKVARKGSIAPLRAPNLVLPSFEDTFSTPPRVWPPKVGVLERTIQAFNTYLFSKSPDFARLSASPGSATSSSGKRRRSSTALADDVAQRLPRSWEVMGDKARASQRGIGAVRKIVVIGVHGWFAQFAILKNVMGEPTGTSFKFAKEMSDAVRRHFKEAGWELNPEAITVIALEGDGKVADRVHRLSVSLLSNPAWVKDLHEADAIFFSAHSQGSVVATELLARLIEQKHIAPERTRVCLLAMAGIHEGPFPHLQSAIISSYLNYFETAAAKELFDFMTSTAHVSESYAAALRIVLAAGVKAIYVASVDDQVVPLHGALHTAVSHPSILRALYIDGQAFPQADFLTNLLVLCTQVRNAGLNDHDVLSLLSTVVAGSLYSGLGHSNVYEEPQVYDLAVRYLFETTHPCSEPTCSGDHRVTMPAVTRKTFQAQAQNPYSLPWAIRGLLEDPDVRELFSEHMADLLDQFAQWRPTNKAQKDVQFRLSPLKSIQIPGMDRQRTGSSASSSKANSPTIPSSSKL